MYASDTDAALLLCSPNEQKDKILQELAKLDWEIQASQARFQREQEALLEHRDRLQALLDHCDDN